MDVWILWYCLDHRFFSSWLFPSFLTIMLNKGAELFWMMEIICLAVVNLTSFSALSSSRVVFCLCLVDPWMGRGLAALPAGARYAWDTPVTPPGTASTSLTFPVQHSSQCPSLAPCMSASQLCPGFKVPWQEGGCSPHSCYRVCDFQCPHVFWIGADLPLPIPNWLGILQWFRRPWGMQQYQDKPSWRITRCLFSPSWRGPICTLPFLPFTSTAIIIWTCTPFSFLCHFHFPSPAPVPPFLWQESLPPGGAVLKSGIGYRWVIDGMEDLCVGRRLLR